MTDQVVTDLWLALQSLLLCVASRDPYRGVVHLELTEKEFQNIRMLVKAHKPAEMEEPVMGIDDE